MTTIEPIDVDKNEASALIDFENIRLSWEKAYGRLFRYTDLCWLCDLVEHQYSVPINRIIVFMSDPKECEGTVGTEQLAEMKRILAILEEDQLHTVQGRQHGKNANELQLNANLNKKRAIGQYQRNRKRAKVLDVGLNSNVSLEDVVILDDSDDEVEQMCSNDVTDRSISTSSYVEADTQYASKSEKGKDLSDILVVENNTAIQSSVLSESSNFNRKCHPILSEKNYSKCNMFLQNCTGVPKKGYDEVLSYTSEFNTKNQSDFKDNSTGSYCILNAVEKTNESKILDPKDEESAIEPTLDTVTGDNDEAPFVRLGANVCSKAEVYVRVFGYKQSGRRRIQRACDVAIGNEVTKLCFMSRFNQIYLFSADSDFEETTRSCAEAEDIGGVIKYAKQIRIFGFSQAFPLKTAVSVRCSYRKAFKLKRKPRCQNPQIHFIDYEFPIIRRIIKQRPLLQISGPQQDTRFQHVQNKLYQNSVNQKNQVENTSVPNENTVERTRMHNLEDSGYTSTVESVSQANWSHLSSLAYDVSTASMNNHNNNSNNNIEYGPELSKTFFSTVQPKVDAYLSKSISVPPWRRQLHSSSVTFVPVQVASGTSNQFIQCVPSISEENGSAVIRRELPWTQTRKTIEVSDVADDSVPSTNFFSVPRGSFISIFEEDAPLKDSNSNQTRNAIQGSMRNNNIMLSSSISEYNNLKSQSTENIASLASIVSNAPTSLKQSILNPQSSSFSSLACRRPSMPPHAVSWT